MTREDERFLNSILQQARSRFAAKTSFSILSIDGINGLQIILTDLETGEIIKKTPLAKQLSKIGYQLKNII